MRFVTKFWSVERLSGLSARFQNYKKFSSGITGAVTDLLCLEQLDLECELQTIDSKRDA
jgi:hypothetical protein